MNYKVFFLALTMSTTALAYPLTLNHNNETGEPHFYAGDDISYPYHPDRMPRKTVKKSCHDRCERREAPRTYSDLSCRLYDHKTRNLIRVEKTSVRDHYGVYSTQLVVQDNDNTMVFRNRDITERDYGYYREIKAFDGKYQLIIHAHNNGRAEVTLVDDCGVRWINREVFSCSKF